MANRKLKSLKFPGIDDTYILDAGNVNYSDEETYEEGSVGKGLNDLKEDMSHKAEIDGYYVDLTAGSAEQLISNMFEEDTDPYQFRTAGGSLEIGDRMDDEIVGGSLVWNQVIINHVSAEGSSTKNDVTFTRKTDGTIVIDGTASGSLWLSEVWTWYLECDFTGREGHKLLLDMGAVFGSSARQIGGANRGYPLGTGKSATVVECTSGGKQSLQFNIIEGETFDNFVLKPHFHDLTQMFGSAIADYIYTLEQGTAGAGIAWFRRYFPKEYYAYSVPTMAHVSASAHETTGFNQWDEEWELGTISPTDGTDVAGNAYYRSKNYIRLLPNTAYYFEIGTSDTIGLRFYDVNKNFIGVNVLVGSSLMQPSTIIPTNAYYMRFVNASRATYQNDICINLHWDGERDGDYEPYVKHTYALDPTVVLMGRPTLDTENNLKFDGDIYHPNGEIDRRYMLVSYDGSSDENWSLQSINDAGIANFGVSIYSNPAKNSEDVICNRFERQISLISQTTTEGFMISANTTLYIRISSTKASTVADFKTWLASNPVEVVYLLQNPTTEEADPFTSPQVVDNWGTEEYVTEGIIPIGHRSQYMPDLKAKVEASPNSPSADGYYLMKRENGENSYVQFIGELPTDPSEDGTYTLGCTVSSGVATKTWVAQE